MDNKQAFTYHYSAGEKSRVEKIRSQYIGVKTAPHTEEELFRLDRSVRLPGKIVGSSSAIFGTLILGGGLSMIIKGGEALYLPGITVGAAGLLMLGAAFPLSVWITSRRRKENAGRIIALSDELLGSVR